MKAIAGIMIGIGILFVGAGVPARQEAGGKAIRAIGRGRPDGHRTAELRPSNTPGVARTGTNRPTLRDSSPMTAKGRGRSTDSGRMNAGASARPRRSSRSSDAGCAARPSDGTRSSRWVGTDFVWEASPQDPDAIEILYHATDFRGPVVNFGESPSIYFGLMRVEPKTPAILHALVDWCMHVENTMDWYWAGWIGRTHRAELLSYLKPYLDSGDEATRKRAAVVEKYLSEAPDASKAYQAWSREIVRAKSGHRLPGVEKALRTGGSRERLDTLKRSLAEGLPVLMGESFVDAFRACADDKDPAVRREVTRILDV